MRRFDLAVVGGGIFGACAAWDAALRGLDVALIERSDFGGQTSANSFKVVHGGIRYVQHADLVRVRESSRERSALLRMAPHLVQPLPIAIPTYGHGKASKPFLAAGMLAYDLLTLDRNRGIADASRRIPRFRSVSRTEALEHFPALDRRGLTGAIVFCDGQMYNPPRLVLAFLRAAVEEGAVVANHVAAVRLRREGDKVTGVDVQDRLGGERFAIRARAVLNAAGPWAEHLLKDWLGRPLSRPSAYSRDACFVVRRRFPGPWALAVQGRTRDPDAVLARGARHLFVAPWRDYSLIGVWHKVWREEPDGVAVTPAELQTFIDEINDAYPALDLTLDDVLLYNTGLLPFGDNAADATDLSYGKRSILIDHAREHGLDGLVTLIGIRYSMGRGDAEKAVDLVTKKLARRAPRPDTQRLRVFGGAIGNFEGLVQEVVDAAPAPLPHNAVRPLAHNHGSEWRRVVAYAEAEPALAESVPGSTVLKAEVVHAIREEMAMTLADVIFRRTDLATGEAPSEAAQLACAELAARELGWGAERKQAELDQVRQTFKGFRRGRVMETGDAGPVL